MNLTFEQLPFVYQAEALAHARWWAGMGIKTTYQQLEDDVKQEALKIWNEEKYDQHNILRNFTRNLPSVVIVLNRFLSYKRTSSFGDGTDLNYRRSTGNMGMLLVNEIYQKQLDKNQQLQTQLAQLQTSQTNNQELQNQVNQQQQTITNLNNTNNQLQNDLNQSNQQNTQLQNDKNTLQQQNQSLNSQLEQSKKEKEQLIQQVQDKDQEINKLNQQLQEHQTCQAEKEELQKQITQLEKEKQELQQQLDEAWNELTGGTRMEAKMVQQTNLPLKGGNK